MYKTFSSTLTVVINKLECLFLAGFFQSSRIFAEKISLPGSALKAGLQYDDNHSKLVHF